VSECFDNHSTLSYIDQYLQDSGVIGAKKSALLDMPVFLEYLKFKKAKSSSVMLQTTFHQVEQFLFLRSVLLIEAN